ncbi:hypothetical protein KM043_002093 [Ampulex compressa]|nr:hypothetical protein KM043_002093 [Ampulex compressa]
MEAISLAKRHSDDLYPGDEALLNGFIPEKGVLVSAILDSKVHRSGTYQPKCNARQSTGEILRLAVKTAASSRIEDRIKTALECPFSSKLNALVRDSASKNSLNETAPKFVDKRKVRVALGNSSFEGESTSCRRLIGLIALIGYPGHLSAAINSGPPTSPHGDEALAVENGKAVKSLGVLATTPGAIVADERRVGTLL